MWIIPIWLILVNLWSNVTSCPRSANVLDIWRSSAHIWIESQNIWTTLIRVCRIRCTKEGKHAAKFVLKFNLSERGLNSVTHWLISFGIFRCDHMREYIKNEFWLSQQKTLSNGDLQKHNRAIAGLLAIFRRIGNAKMYSLVYFQFASWTNSAEFFVFPLNSPVQQFHFRLPYAVDVIRISGDSFQFEIHERTEQGVTLASRRSIRDQNCVRTCSSLVAIVSN